MPYTTAALTLAAAASLYILLQRRRPAPHAGSDGQERRRQGVGCKRRRTVAEEMSSAEKDATAAAETSIPAGNPARRCLKDLEASDVPVELTVAHYIDLKAAAEREYEHITFLRMAHNVSAVLDGLPRYVTGCLTACIEVLRANSPKELMFAPGAAADGSAPVCASVGHSAVWLRHAQSTTFSPERMIGSPSPSAESAYADGTAALLMVLPGAKIYGGTFDVSNGPIWLGERVRPRPVARGCGCGSWSGEPRGGGGGTVPSGGPIRRARGCNR